jgi:hypothetical protein
MNIDSCIYVYMYDNIAKLENRMENSDNFLFGLEQISQNQ